MAECNELPAPEKEQFFNSIYKKYWYKVYHYSYLYTGNQKRGGRYGAGSVPEIVATARPFEWCVEKCRRISVHNGQE
jgi:hypothetical protein